MTISLDLAIAAIQSNRREEGRQLLNLLIQQNPNDEMAWLWMSEVVEKEEQRARCLYHVLAINPHSTVARQGLQRLGIEITASRPVTVEPPKVETKPVPTQTPPIADERHPKRLDPKAITQAMPLNSPFSETAVATPADESARKKELSNTKQRLRFLTQALVEQQLGQDSRPVPVMNGNVPLPDFDAALAQVNQLPLEKTFMVAPSRPMKLPLNPSRPSPAFAAYAAPSQPMRPIAFNQMGYDNSMFTQLTRPSQPIGLPHAQTMGMQFQSQPIPVVHANTTLGMPYPGQMAYAGNNGFHANATLGMPIQVGGYQPMPQPAHSDRELIAAYQSANQRLKSSQAAEVDEDDEEVNVVAVFILGFLFITALGGIGLLFLLFLTTGF